MGEITIKGFNIAFQACLKPEGEMVKLTEKTGARNMTVLEETCIYQGDAVRSWLVSWEE